jgi:hypothetical protein
MQEYKELRFPDDKRIVTLCGFTPRGTLSVNGNKCVNGARFLFKKKWHGNANNENIIIKKWQNN